MRPITKCNHLYIKFDRVAVTGFQKQGYVCLNSITDTLVNACDSRHLASSGWNMETFED